MTDPKVEAKQEPLPPPPPETKQEPAISSTAQDDENIPHPYLELYRHTSLRGANLGSVLSLLIAPPLPVVQGGEESQGIHKENWQHHCQGNGKGLAGGPGIEGQVMQDYCKMGWGQELQKEGKYVG